MKPLTAVAVSKIKKPGHHAVGGATGLYLQISPAGTRSWAYRFWVSQRNTQTGEFVRDPETGKVVGRVRETGLGSCDHVSLAQARDAAIEARKRWRESGTDPLEARRDARMRAALEQAKNRTFDQAVVQYLATHSEAWRNAKHRQQWANTLRDYASPILGQLPVAMIDTDAILRTLEPLWSSKTRTASRLQRRVARVLDFAIARGWREGPNPAAWRGHLITLLAAPGKVAKEKHHAAMEYQDIGQFMLSLRQEEGVAARALEFCVATCSRIGAVRKMRWCEVDSINQTWVVPSENLKVDGQDLRIPLNAIAIRVLEQMRELGEGADDFVFFGKSPQHPLGHMVVDKLREAMREANHWPLNRKGELPTTHGFRSTFKSFAEDKTTFKNGVIETSLQHRVGNKVEQSYMRSQLFDQRRQLMTEWARLCSRPWVEERDNVVPMRSAQVP